jgi:hypothetical protein
MHVTKKVAAANSFDNSLLDRKEPDRHSRQVGQLSERTLRRAADDLGVVKKKEDFNGGWAWSLPVRN